MDYKKVETVFHSATRGKEVNLELAKDLHALMWTLESQEERSYFQVLLTLGSHPHSKVWQGLAMEISQ